MLCGILPPQIRLLGQLKCEGGLNKTLYLFSFHDLLIQSYLNSLYSLHLFPPLDLKCKLSLKLLPCVPCSRHCFYASSHLILKISSHQYFIIFILERLNNLTNIHTSKTKSLLLYPDVCFYFALSLLSRRSSQNVKIEIP